MGFQDEAYSTAGFFEVDVPELLSTARYITSSGSHSK
jgi:hypothetical protein